MDDSAVIVQVNVCHINRHLTNGLVLCFTGRLKSVRTLTMFKLNSFVYCKQDWENQFDLRLKLMIMFGLTSNM